MKVGFIGTGSMGGLLIDSFLRSGALYPQHISASNRSPLKLAQLAARHPGVQVASSNIEVAKDAHIIFLCVKPLHFITVIEEIKDVLTSDQIVVSITSPVQISHLEGLIPAKVAKIIPSITHAVHSGASLCMYSQRIKPEDRLLLQQLMSSVGTPVSIVESHTRIASDISSCGPAFISFILEQWINSAAELTGIDKDTAAKLGAEMLLGTGRLLTEGGFTLDELQRRVSVPGGITEEGISLLREALNGVFPRLIQVTHNKYKEDLNKLNQIFHNPI